jgi:hypothetical protein
MLHAITRKILKSSYFWLLENPGCYRYATKNSFKPYGKFKEKV